MEEIAGLVVRATAKDGVRDDRLKAFEKLVQLFQDMAFGYAYSILGDFHLAEDAAQEAFVSAYQQLEKLRDPGAFAAWLRKIVRTACNRMLRQTEVATTSLETAGSVAAKEVGPAKQVEKIEMRDEVLAAIQSLSEPERTATTLFYINGYSQKDIAQFLEVSVPTVTNRLRTSRKRLKERMITMVRDTLHKNAPNECFSKKVIDELLNRPRLLEIPGHPIREVFEAVSAALSNYDIVVGEEIVDRSAFLGMSGDDSRVYHITGDSILRDEMTITTFQAMAGKNPPVRLLSAGRVFRPSVEDMAHQKVFHQVDGVCISDGLTSNDMKSTCQQILEAALGPVQLRWGDAKFRRVEDAKEVAAMISGQWLEIGGCGMLTAEILRNSGYDPQTVTGFAFALGLDRLAMFKYDIDDIGKLWRPPHMPG